MDKGQTLKLQDASKYSFLAHLSVYSVPARCVKRHFKDCNLPLWSLNGVSAIYV